MSEINEIKVPSTFRPETYNDRERQSICIAIRKITDHMNGYISIFNLLKPVSGASSPDIDFSVQERRQFITDLAKKFNAFLDNNDWSPEIAEFILLARKHVESVSTSARQAFLTD